MLMNIWSKHTENRSFLVHQVRVSPSLKIIAGPAASNITSNQTRFDASNAMEQALPKTKDTAAAAGELAFVDTRDH